MKFAFMIMGDFDTDQDSAVIHDGSARIVGVASVEEACAEAKNLLEEGIGCIELCGASFSVRAGDSPLNENLKDECGMDFFILFYNTYSISWAFMAECLL